MIAVNWSKKIGMNGREYIEKRLNSEWAFKRYAGVIMGHSEKRHYIIKKQGNNNSEV